MSPPPSDNAAAAARAHLVAERVLSYDAEGDAATAEDDCDLVGAWTPQPEEHLEACYRLGERCRQACGHLPAIAAQTWFSLHLGGMSPAAWGAFLAGCDAPAGERLLLADRGDLAALPEALRAWGRDRLAVGATLFLPSGDEAVLLAPDQPAYARLCQLLSRQHEEDGLVARWAADRCPPPDCDGLIALVRDLEWLRLLREAGAEVYWRGELAPEPVPAGVAAATLPLVRHVDARTAAIEPVLDA
ncbi:MAG: hypothetical protein ACOCXJ_07855, partial [Planctomycetota bacterium]